MPNNEKTISIFMMLSFILLLTGCDRLKAIDSEIGKLLNKETLEDVAEPIVNNSENTKPSELAKSQKEKIDLWLKANNYNRYGDVLDTYYAGGSPLVDEVKNQIKERYEYIMEKHPDILTKI